MNSEELLGLMVDRSEAAAPNQIAKFKELLQKAKEAHPENKTLGLKKITIDTPVFFDFDSILNEFRHLDTQMISGSTGRDKQGPLYGQFSRLLMRVDSRLNDRRYDLIFKPQTYNTSASMEDLFRRLLGEQKTARKKVVVIDLSPVPFDVRSSVISLILRCLFDFAYWYRRVFSTRYPIAVFADEAHIYLRDGDAGTEATKHSAERIAKEGRKYGHKLNCNKPTPSRGVCHHFVSMRKLSLSPHFQSRRSVPCQKLVARFRKRNLSNVFDITARRSHPSRRFCHDAHKNKDRRSKSSSAKR